MFGPDGRWIEVLTIKYKPLEWQAVVKRQASLYRFFTLVVHRNAGKTWNAVATSIEETLRCPYPHAVGAYIAPEKAQAKKVVWGIYKELLAKFPDKYCKFVESEVNPHIVFFEGTTKERKIYVLGAKDPDALRGMRLDHVVLDETADMPRGFFSLIIRPALRKSKDYLKYDPNYKSKVMFIGTPRGKDDFYEFYRKGRDGAKGWGSALYTVNDTGVYTDEEIQEIQADDTDGAFEQEYMCSFYPRSKGAYFAKAITLLAKDKRFVAGEVDPRLPILSGWDIGYDHTCAWCLQFQEINGIETPVIVDFIGITNEDLPTCIDAFKSRFKGKKVGVCYIPHDGAKRLPSDKNLTLQGIFKAAGLKTSLCQRVNKDAQIIGAIEFINKVSVLSSVEMDFAELLNYKERIDKRTGLGLGIPVHDEASHPADAFITLALNVKKMHGGLWTNFDKEVEDVEEPTKVLGVFDMPKVNYFESPKMRFKSGRTIQSS